MKNRRLQLTTETLRKLRARELRRAAAGVWSAPAPCAPAPMSPCACPGYPFDL